MHKPRRVRFVVLAALVLGATTSVTSAGAATDVASRARAYDCRFSDGVVVMIEPARDRAVVVDAGITIDEFGQRVQDEGSYRLVAVLTPRRLIRYSGCTRPQRPVTRRYTHLIGPWPARVFSRALCGVFGRNIRLDVIPLRGGGFRMTFSGIGGPRSAAFVAAEIRPRDRGGVWIDSRYCGRLGR